MGILERSQHGDVVVLRWNDGENRYRGDSVAEWHATLDELAGSEGPLALVVTGTGKFFSNGLDLDWMGANRDESPAMLAEVQMCIRDSGRGGQPPVDVLKGLSRREWARTRSRVGRDSLKRPERHPWQPHSPRAVQCLGQPRE